jgi:hypothetical protein
VGKAIGGVPFRTGETRWWSSHFLHDLAQILGGHTSGAGWSLVKHVVKISYGLRIGAQDRLDLGYVEFMSAARAAAYLMDQGPFRRELAIELARGIAADDRSAADEVAVASVILRRAGFVEEALVVAGIAAARGADLPAETKQTRWRWQVRRRGPFSRAA